QWDVQGLAEVFRPRTGQPVGAAGSGSGRLGEGGGHEPRVETGAEEDGGREETGPMPRSASINRSHRGSPSESVPALRREGRGTGRRGSREPAQGPHLPRASARR